MFKEPDDNKEIYVDIERSYFWGFFKERIEFKGMFSTFKEFLKTIGKKNVE